MQIDHLLFRATFVLAMMPCVAIAQDISPGLTLMSNGQVSVKIPDVLEELSTAPDQVQLQLRNNTDALRRMVESIYLRRALANQALAEIGHQTKIKKELEIIRERTLGDALLAHLTKDARPSDEAALSYARALYRAEPDKFMNSPEYRVRQIYFPTNSVDNTCNARQTALEVLDRIRTGADFIAIATQHASSVESSSKGGDMGFIKPDNQDPEVAAALRKLDAIGQVSNLVVTPSAILILKLEEKRPARVKPFEEVQDELIKQAQIQVSAQARTKIIKQVMDAALGDPDNLNELASLLKDIPKSKK